jgi:hypothetical protein
MSRHCRLLKLIGGQRELGKARLADSWVCTEVTVSSWSRQGKKKISNNHNRNWEQSRREQKLRAPSYVMSAKKIRDPPDDDEFESFRRGQGLLLHRSHVIEKGHETEVHV